MDPGQVVTQLLIGLVPALVVAAGAYLGVRHAAKMQERAELRSRAEDAERIVHRYRDPLIRAAFDLQSRLYNIAMNDFLGKYLVRGAPAEQEYARESSLYVIAEYFGWVEILRREVQFLDLRDVGRNRELSERLDRISRAFLAERPDTTLRAFRGEQRALGEVMTHALPSGVRECIGYAAFVARRQDADFTRWFGPLAASVDRLAGAPTHGHPRLVEVQHALIDLIDFLDPDHEYFGGAQRSKIPVGASAAATPESQATPATPFRSTG